MSETSASVIWALERMIAIRKAGEHARFRVTWADRQTLDGRRREYRLEIRREDGTIERPIWPFPLGTPHAVEESAAEAAKDELPKDDAEFGVRGSD